MNRFAPLILISILIFSAACLGEGVKNAEMTLDTKVSEVTGSLNSTEITAADFLDLYEEGNGDFVLIDVRTKREFDEGYIPGAVHIPYTELDRRIDELNLSKDQKIVLYCEAGVRSKKGANALLDIGYTNIVDVTDGMRGWQAMGGEIKIPGAEPQLVTRGLISAGELAENLGAYKTLFIGTNNQYSNGHIPGAVHIDPLSELVDPDGVVEHMALNRGDFEALMSEKGVTPDAVVVVYDAQNDLKYASRMFWILKRYGHENVAVLDGGLAAWKSGGAELSTTPAEITPTEYVSSGGSIDDVATLEYVNESLGNSGVVLVEATTKEEYEEEGHIPGAVLVEPEETVNADGTVKDPAELQKLYDLRGITRDKEIITYCHTGHRGATIWFELKHLLKYPRVKVYDGSLEEWNAQSMLLEYGAAATIATASTTTRSTTTTMWTTTTTPAPAASKPRYLDVEPKLVLEDFEGVEPIQMNTWDVVKIGDSYIYITADFDGCVGIVWWTFNIYHDTPDGAVWEGKTNSFMNEEVKPNQDISDSIHAVSDTLDDYTIVVTRWSEAEGLDIEISR